MVPYINNTNSTSKTMIEKQKRLYDDDVAREQIALRDQHLEAIRRVAADKINENALEQSHRAGKLARALGSRSLRRYADNVRSTMTEPGSVARYPDGQEEFPNFDNVRRMVVTMEENKVKQHLSDNFEQIYDNAVVEANMDFTNRRIDERVRTPDVVALETQTVTHDTTPDAQATPRSRYELVDVIPQTKSV